MVISRALIVLPFLLNLNKTLAWDGCGGGGNLAWRCGDTCISGHHGAETECKCGAEVFNHTAQKWCCNDKPCVGRGANQVLDDFVVYQDYDHYDYWLGEYDQEGRRIGAECNGTALNLDESCNEKCNDHEEDQWRNEEGLLRSYRACNVKNIKTTQCIREDKYLDGNIDCRNRADEEIFQTSIGNTSSLLLDLELILKPCNDSRGDQGFFCSGSSNVDAEYDGDIYDEVSQSNCLALNGWCAHNSYVHTCIELAGTTATGKTTDPKLCGNQTFWEQKSCNHDKYHRCTGVTPGQCVRPQWGDKCLDGSSEIREPKDGYCDGEELMCTAYGGKWRKQKVCIKDQYKCDRVRHCDGNEDETNCTQEATSDCFERGDCDKAYKAPAGGHCEAEDELMCTARDGRFARKKICVEKKFQCDNHLQCKDGKDEEKCEEDYKKKGIFTREHRIICRSPFLIITSEENQTGKFFPVRAIRCNQVVIIVSILIILILVNIILLREDIN